MIVEQGNPLGYPSSTDCAEQWNPQDWRDYFAKTRNDYEIPPELFQLAPIPCFLSDSHSHMLTLQHVFSLPQVVEVLPPQYSKKLVVHLCGATIDDKYAPGRFVEMIRLNPQLEELQIHAFGPEQYFIDMNKAVHMEAIRSTCHVHLEEHIGLYHDIMRSNAGKNIPDPTVVFLPHPGMHDHAYTDSWRPTIEYLVEKDVLVVVTGCNHKEGLDDSQLLRDWGATILVEPRPNPFRGLRPLPDPTREHGDFFYTNASFFVAKGKI